MKHRILVIAAVVGAVMAPMAPVGASSSQCPSGTGRISDNLVQASVCAPGQEPTRQDSNDGGQAPPASGGSAEPSPYRWTRDYPTQYPSGLTTVDDPTSSRGLRTVASPTPTCTGPDGQPGRPYIDTLTDSRTGEVVSTGRGCAVPGVGGGPNAEPLPPPPPSAGEIIQDAPLPTLTFTLNPGGQDCSVTGAGAPPANAAPPCGAGQAPGLTGLESLLWVDPAPPAETSVSVEIRGYSVTTRAHPVAYRWEMRQDGDTASSRNPQPIFTTTGPGTADAPAARYRWETKGDYHVGLRVVWEGSYTFSGFGVSRTEALGPVTGAPTIVSYHVVEVRSVPTAPPVP